jgi:hypothetical protein
MTEDEEGAAVDSSPATGGGDEASQWAPSVYTSSLPPDRVLVYGRIKPPGANANAAGGGAGQNGVGTSTHGKQVTIANPLAGTGEARSFKLDGGAARIPNPLPLSA